MQWQLEDAMFYALEVLDGERARAQYERAAVADAQQRVQELLKQGRR